jgi:hypothetical protein
MARASQPLALLRNAAKTTRAYSRPLLRAYVKSFSLRAVSNKTKRIGKNDIILCCCQRNEFPRLPFFFEYYRRLGVAHFLFIDNNSDDGSREWLAEQADCSVWRTSASYKDSNFGIDWANALLRRYGSGHWCLTVDPDEFLVFPRMETRSLRGLCQLLDEEARRSFQAVMLDAYSDKPLSESHYRTGEDPFAVCPYFDRDGYIQDEGWGHATFIQGGPRLRTYFAENPAAAPALNKTPLVRWRWHYHYRSSMHDCRPYYLNNAQRLRPMPTTGCLFHFKFMSSLSAKVTEEMTRKQHYANSAEYKRYASAADVILYREGVSTRYESSQQLVELGLMSQGSWF